MAANSKPVFSPPPARALSDTRLTAEEHRVLQAIAVHDRFSKNGIGCTASHTRLAALVGCHLKSLSRTIRTLAEKGYIGGRANPLNPKSRCYFVIYNEMDEALLKTPIGNSAVTYEGSNLVTSNDLTGNNPATTQVTTPFPIGNKVEKNAQQNQEDASYNIFSETVNISRETEEKNPAEAAPGSTNDEPMRGGNDARAHEGEASFNVGENLARLERSMKAGIRLDWPKWATWLECVIIERPRDDACRQWAERLVQMLPI